MHAILDAVFLLGRGLLFLVEAFFNLMTFLDAVYDTGCGLCWLFSSDYRKALREEPNGPGKRLRQLSVFFGLLFVGVVLAVLGIVAFRVIS